MEEFSYDNLVVMVVVEEVVVFLEMVVLEEVTVVLMVVVVLVFLERTVGFVCDGGGDTVDGGSQW